MTKTYANRSNARRAAKSANVDLDAVTFVQDAEGAWYWQAAEQAAPKAPRYKLHRRKPALAVQVTENEHRVLRALVTNDYSSNEDTTDGSTWSNCIDSAREPSNLAPASLGGVVASLVAKGLVHSSNEGKDSVITWASKAAYKFAAGLGTAPAQEPAPQAAPAAAAPAKAAALPPAKTFEVYGRSSVLGPVATVHDYLDKLVAEGQTLVRKDALFALSQMGVNRFTARTQYQRWTAKRAGK
jgi:hypothetical protein